jgi:pentatricopeptide repeat protein
VKVEMAPGTVQLNAFSWNIKLCRYVKAAKYEKTIELFQQMQRECRTPNEFTFVPVLNVCASLLLQALKEARCVDELIIQGGGESDVFVGTQALWTCMPNVGAWRMHGEHSQRCPPTMWYLGM